MSAVSSKDLHAFGGGGDGGGCGRRRRGRGAGRRVGQKLYLPSALLARQLPAGLGAMQRVPRLLDIEAVKEQR